MIGVVGVLVGLLIGSAITNAVWVLRSSTTETPGSDHVGGGRPQT